MTYIYSRIERVAVTALVSLSPTYVVAQGNLNLAPDCTSAAVAPAIVDPADDRMQALTVTVTDPDADTVSLTTQCILQSEPSEFYSDGTAISGDGAGVGTDTPLVRSKRLTNFILTDTYQYYRSNGRYYDVILRAQDEHGAACTAKVTVEVPLYLGSDQNPDAETKDFGFRFPAAQGSTNCDATAINNPPIIFSELATSAVAGSLFEFQVKGHDPDSETLTYDLAVSPEGAVIDASSGWISWTPTSADVGSVEMVVRVTDERGAMVSEKVVVDVQPNVNVSLSIIANPTVGTSPLTVRFSPKVEVNNLVISSYAWDFDGDGVFDHSDRFGAPVMHTYTGEPGTTFVAKLKATLGEASQNPDGAAEIITTKLITIDNQKPQVSVVSSITNGHAPLTVSFDVLAQDPQGIASIAIDFNGDGAYDHVFAAEGASPISTSFSTIYSTEGRYIASVKVVDGSGAETIILNNAITVDVNSPSDPIITLSASVIEGPTPLASELTAEASIFDGSTIESWTWDLDGDGEFETTGGASTSDIKSYSYTGLDEYYPSVKVTTSSGRDAIASTKIKTTSTGVPILSISDSSDTINLDNMEMSDFTVSLPYDTLLSMKVEGPDGQLVKTLSSSDHFAAGTHTFVWDGTDDSETNVSEGDYYVVIDYQAYGEVRTVDLRSSTGGVQTFYTRTIENPDFFNRLEKPINIQYEVDNPAEVTFFWQVSMRGRLMTMLEHERMGRGSYSLMWNGEYPNGLKVEPEQKDLMPGIIRYDLADNVIYVKEDPRIIDFKLASTIVVDPRREPVEIQLSLSKLSGIELVVADMEKGVDVANRYYPEQSGAAVIEWDGKNDEGQLLAPGDYRIGVRAVDAIGNRSLYWFRTQRIGY